MTIYRIWEGKRECSDELYYEGQVFLSNGCTQTVTKQCESESEAQYYLGIVAYGLNKLKEKEVLKTVLDEKLEELPK